MVARLKLYVKEGCWLCDAAEEMLNGLKGRHALEVEKVDITGDEKLYELYRFDIPVVEFEDGGTLWGDIRKKDVLRRIERLSP